MNTVLFYISGHGYGHVVRMAQVIRELRQLVPGWRILARTEAPAQMVPPGVECTSAEFDAGVVESEAGVVIDEAATLERVRRLVSSWDIIVEREAGFVRENCVRLIVADIPGIAGQIAHAAGVPCMGISNFTWDWIYEPYAREYLSFLEEGYSRMEVLLRLPFAQRERLGWFRRVVDAPLIASQTRAHAQRPRGSPIRALLASRAQVSNEVLGAAKADAPEFEFVIPPLVIGFAETFESCDVIIAKLGFSLVAESIAGRKPVLYPPRLNFREDEVLLVEAPQHLQMLPIPQNDFKAGRWGHHLRQLVAMPPVTSGLRTDGARFCAEFIAGF
ncbi:MAG TPA: hypothetical protein VER03_01815 [Bryobacteraceae bacterium]|nr:hypothetical protein [Bryobacteraceae bacterium]